MPVTTVDLRIEGEAHDDPAFQDLARDFPVRPGAPLDHGAYQRAKEALQDLAQRRGYLDARITEHAIRLDLAAYGAEIVLHFSSGPRYRFGEIRFTPQPLDETFLRRYLNFGPGDPYLLSALLQLENALRDSDYFTDVEVRALRAEAADGNVPVLVRLTPKKRSKFTFGLGYGTDTGARGSAGWELRRVNRHGHRVQTEVQAAESGASLSATYLVPGKRPSTDQYAFTASLDSEDTDSSESDTFKLGISQRLQKGELREERSLSYQREDFVTGASRGSSNLLMPAISWSRTWADDPIYTRHGARISLELRGAAQHLLSDTSFAQATVHGKLIRPLGANGRVILRGDLGATYSGDFSALPASLRYYAGGDQSVRGYGYQELGPRDNSGAVVGGRYLLVGSMEYEHRLSESWSGAVFLDSGNALDGFHEALHEGAGIGLRWHSPVGLVRVDLANAIDEPGKPWRVHLMVGPDL